MRLEKIRLSGFKSFVDPTTIALPGNLIGIVGRMVVASLTLLMPSAG